MLKARQPEDFAHFIMGLCRKLSEIIITNYGIFDKFTGDGILAFFPDFYSGPDAGLLAVDAALKCHAFFEEHYKAHRNCFTSILRDIGLGIGIDSGPTFMVKIQGSLTLVGTPVVYTCRMSGAPATETLLNQPGFEEIFEKYSTYFNFEETALDIKNEGKILAYRITSNKAEYQPQVPDWKKLTEYFKPRTEQQHNKRSEGDGK
jgi:hypothetical protein